MAWLWFRAWSVELREAWALHGPWIETTKPDSRVLRRETFATAADSSPEDDAEARRIFATLRSELRRRIAPGSVLCLPTAAALPPRRDDPAPPSLRPTFCLMSIAGIGGLPQVSIPAGWADGVPVGLSLVGAPGSDEDLLALAGEFQFPG